jgi:hypothetical protein
MPPETTEDLNLPSTATDGSHLPSTDVPDDPAASASAEIFAAMNGSTLADAGLNEDGTEVAEGETDAAEETADQPASGDATAG